jgi:decaprenylphospho-beta-D-erythro-pentofuranosid-2-ulose 2-reductase
MNDAFGRPQSVVVLGGTSDIAREVLARLAGDRCRSVVLAGRDRSRLESAAVELRRSVSHVETVLFDATETDNADKTVVRCFEAAGEAVDLVLVAVGELGHQEEDEADPERVAAMVTVNFTWPAAALSRAAAVLTQQGHGRIIVLSTVAGYRVRRSNYVYGSAKAGLDGFALGLGEALRGSGVALHIVRPGFVRTKMTVGRPAAPFAVGPDRVASDIVRGVERGQSVIWSPGMLRWVFSVLRLLPQAVWRRLPG